MSFTWEALKPRGKKLERKEKRLDEHVLDVFLDSHFLLSHTAFHYF